jgi:OOP family OmpA-OmpF porin
MKKHLFGYAVLIFGALGAAPAVAGYWFDSSDQVWRTSAGECVRTGYWTPEAIIVGCDGKTAQQIPAPVPVAVTPAAVPKVSEASVGFGFDRADLDANAVAALDGMLDKATGNVKAVRLTGHADRIGTEDYNLDLSLRRATAVADYLAEQRGIDPQKTEIRGQGESEPLVACDGVFGQAAVRCLAPNRRVDVVVDVF